VLSDHGCKNIRVTTKGTMCERADWIHMSQKSDLKGVVVKTAVNHPASKEGNEFFDT